MSEPTTPAFAHQAATMRLTIYVDALPPADADVQYDDGLSAAFFEALRPAVEAFSVRHPELIIVITP